MKEQHVIFSKPHGTMDPSRTSFKFNNSLYHHPVNPVLQSFSLIRQHQNVSILDHSREKDSTRVYCTITIQFKVYSFKNVQRNDQMLN